MSDIVLVITISDSVLVKNSMEKSGLENAKTEQFVDRFRPAK